MTVHEVRTCEATPEAWAQMILSSVQRDEPPTVEAAVKLAVEKTMLAVGMRQVISGDAAAVVKQINQSHDREN